MKLHERLLALRKVKGITQEELSRDLDIKRPRYNAWEMGTARPDLEMLAKLAQYYAVTTDFLLGLPHRDSTRLLSDDAYADGYTDASYLAALEDTLKEQLNRSSQGIRTIAAHLKGKDLTPQKIKLLEQYIDTLFDEDQ